MKAFISGCDGGDNADCPMSLGSIFYSTKDDAIEALNMRVSDE